MKITIHSAEELGLALRAVRKDSRVRLDDLAQTVRVSKQTATSVEQGKAKLATALAFLHEMGMEVSVDIPRSALPIFQKLQSQASRRTLVSDGKD